MYFRIDREDYMIMQSIVIKLEKALSFPDAYIEVKEKLLSPEIVSTITSAAEEQFEGDTTYKFKETRYEEYIGVAFVFENSEGETVEYLLNEEIINLYE